MENNNKRGFNLFDLIAITKTYKKQIFIPTGIAFLLITFFMFFIADPIYQSVAVVKTISKSGGLSSLLSGGAKDMTDLADLGDITGGGGVTRELALYENILMSRKNVEEVILKFKLNDEWEFKYTQEAVKNFRENVLEIKKDKLAGTMEIGIYDKNPERAKEIAGFMVTQLNKINIDLNVQNAKTNREFVEQRYNKIREDLRKAEDSLKFYQDVNGIALDAKTKVIAETEMKLDADIQSEQIKLELLRKILSPDQAEVKAQESKINAMKSELDKIKNSTDNNNTELRLKDKPGKVLGYLRLAREVEIQSKLLTFIIPLFEQAKIDEKKEMPSVLVIDQPYYPEFKAKPKRIKSILLFTFPVFFLSFLIALIRSQVKKYYVTTDKIS